MSPDAVLRELIRSAIRGATYRLIWRSPAWVSALIVVLALVYALAGKLH